MFRSLNADHPQGQMFFCTATFCLVVVPRHNFIQACGFVCSVYVVVCALPLLVQMWLCLCLCCCVCSPAARPVVSLSLFMLLCVLSRCSSSPQLDEQRESTHSNINRAHKATCPDKVVPRNNNKANK
jgi:hypothetical protein